jgi:hypothetical protein
MKIGLDNQQLKTKQRSGANGQAEISPPLKNCLRNTGVRGKEIYDPRIVLTKWLLTRRPK